MRNKTILIILVILFATFETSFAMLSLMPLQAHKRLSIFVDTRINLSDKFEVGATKSYKEVFDNYKEIDNANNSLHHAWGGAHKTGVILMASGGGLLVAGVIVGVTGPSPTAEEFFSSQQLAGFMIAVVGISAVIIGTPLLIAGAIHDHRKFGLIAPKNNEIGIAYNIGR